MTRRSVAPLVLASVSALWLASVLIREPDYGRRSRLTAALDGGAMEEFLPGPEEKQTVLSWVENGAPEREWAEVSAIFEAHCLTCHFRVEAQFEVLALDDYASAASAAKVRPVLEEKITGGTMGKYLEAAAEQSAILEWIEGGAREEDWPPVRKIFAAHCVQCHNPEGVDGLPSLVAYAPASRLASLPAPKRLPLRDVLGPAGALVVSILLTGWSMRPA